MRGDQGKELMGDLENGGVNGDNRNGVNGFMLVVYILKRLIKKAGNILFPIYLYPRKVSTKYFLESKIQTSTLHPYDNSIHRHRI